MIIKTEVIHVPSSLHLTALIITDNHNHSILDTLVHFVPFCDAHFTNACVVPIAQYAMVISAILVLVSIPNYMI